LAVLMSLAMAALGLSPLVGSASGQSQDAPPRWEGKAGPQRASSAAQDVSCPSSPAFSFTFNDPVGDAFSGFGAGPVLHDIVALRGRGDLNTFCLTMEFAGPIDPAGAFTERSLAGAVDFDTDEDFNTGFPSLNEFFCRSPGAPVTGLGVDATLDLFSASEGSALLFPSFEEVPIRFGPNSFTAAIPMSALGGDANFNLASVIGTFAEPTDCVPNAGAIHSPTGSNVFVTCGSKPVTLVGSPGNDSLDGTPGPDVIRGGDGNDTVAAGGGDDIICVDNGNDSVNGGQGDDQVFGGAGNDTLLGKAGNDSLVGEGGHDVLVGGDGDDTLVGGTGNDTLRGDGGTNSCDGGPGRNALRNCSGPTP
jgi:hypothetical protein